MSLSDTKEVQYSSVSPCVQTKSVVNCIIITDRGEKSHLIIVVIKISLSVETCEAVVGD